MTDLAKRIAEKLALSLDADFHFDSDAVEAIALVIAPAVAVGWVPSDEELDTLVEGEEDDMADAAANIPGGVGGRLMTLLDRLADEARYSGDEE